MSKKAEKMAAAALSLILKSPNGGGSGVTTDATPTEGSTNPVQSGGVYTALEGKADVDGSYEGLAAGYSTLAENFNSKLTIPDTTPYLFRTTAGGKEVSGQSKLKKIIGASVPIIQICYDPNFTSASNWKAYYDSLTSVSVSNNVLTSTILSLTGVDSTNTYTLMMQESDVYKAPAVVGHKYLFWGDVYSSKSGNMCVYSQNAGNNTAIKNVSANTWTRISGINVATRTLQYMSAYPVFVPEVGDTFKYRNFGCIDLTATFGTTVANRLYALEQAQAGTGIAKAKEILVKDYYPYNVTAFTHTKTSGKVNNGFNQFDEATYFAANGFTHESDGSWKRNGNNLDLMGKTIWENDCNYKGRIQLVCDYKNGDTSSQGLRVNVIYTDGTSAVDYFGAVTSFTAHKLTTSQYKNVQKLVWDYGGGSQITYFKNFCIDFYWDGERDGEYEPYQEWNYPVEDIELKGILSLDAQDNWVADGDEYLPSGVVDENYEEITLDATGWSSYNGAFYRDFSGYKKTTGKNYARSNKLLCDSQNSGIANLIATGRGYFAFRGDSVNVIEVYPPEGVTFTDWIATVTIVYLVDTPTESSANSYTELQNDSNWGTEKWLDTRSVPLPVPSLCEYLPDLKAKLEAAPENPASNGDYIMHREDGINSYGSLSTWLSANGYNKMQDLSSGITDSAGLTYSVKKAYKVGNVVMMTIVAQNATGSSITADTALFTLSSDLTPISTIAGYAKITGDSATFFAGDSGNCTIDKALASNATLRLTITYAVA